MFLSYGYIYICYGQHIKFLFKKKYMKEKIFSKALKKHLYFLNVETEYIERGYIKIYIFKHILVFFFKYKMYLLNCILKT